MTKESNENRALKLCGELLIYPSQNRVNIIAAALAAEREPLERICDDLQARNTELLGRVRELEAKCLKT